FQISELSRQKHQGSASYRLCQPFAIKTPRSYEREGFDRKNDGEGGIGRIKSYRLIQTKTGPKPCFFYLADGEPPISETT
ncbi:hypothetical protein, partial [Serratia sp. OLIL2]|uniref:hypothetical protein n=1 Tax=Serratia sp. OLIL2 TaxID=1914913 RepID=UPI001A7E0A1B